MYITILHDYARQVHKTSKTPSCFGPDVYYSIFRLCMSCGKHIHHPGLVCSIVLLTGERWKFMSSYPISASPIFDLVTLVLANPLELPSGKHTENYGKSPFLMGKSTISMVIFHSFLYVYQAG